MDFNQQQQMRHGAGNYPHGPRPDQFVTYNPPPGPMQPQRHYPPQQQPQPGMVAAYNNPAEYGNMQQNYQMQPNYGADQYRNQQFPAGNQYNQMGRPATVNQQQGFPQQAPMMVSPPVVESRQQPVSDFYFFTTVLVSNTVTNSD